MKQSALNYQQKEMHIRQDTRRQSLDQSRKENGLLMAPMPMMKKCNGDIDHLSLADTLSFQPFILADALFPYQIIPQLQNRKVVAPQEAREKGLLMSQKGESISSPNNKRKRVNGEITDDGQSVMEGLKGLKDLSRRAHQIVNRNHPLTYKQVARCLISEISPFLKQLSPESRQKEELNIRRRVYDALNVLIAASVLQKERKLISPYHQNKSPKSMIVQLKLRAIREMQRRIAETIERTQATFASILSLKQKIARTNKSFIFDLKEIGERAVSEEQMAVEGKRSDELLLELDEMRQRSKLQGKLRRRHNRKSKQPQTCKTTKIKEQLDRIDQSMIRDTPFEDGVAKRQIAKQEGEGSTQPPSPHSNGSGEADLTQTKPMFGDNFVSIQNQSNIDSVQLQTLIQQAIRQARRRRQNGQTKLKASTIRSTEEILYTTSCFNRRLTTNECLPFPTGGFLMKGDFRLQRDASSIKISSHQTPHAISRSDFQRMVFNNSNKLL